MLHYIPLLLLVSHSVMSRSYWSHEQHHTWFSCPSLSPGMYSNSCPVSQWCHPTITSPVTFFSSCLQSFPSSGSFPMSQLFISAGQNFGASASASVLPMNTQELISFRINWLDFLAIQESSPASQFKSINSLALSLLYGTTITSIHDYWKNHSFD